MVLHSPYNSNLTVGKNKNYTLPDTDATASWVKIRNLSTSQGGYVTTMIINSSDGYNGTEEQQQSMELIFTTSNNSDGRVLDNNQVFLGSCVASGLLGEVRIVQLSATNYDFYFNAPAYCGVGTVIINTNGTYTHSGIISTAPTSNYINPVITHYFSSYKTYFYKPVVCSSTLSCSNIYIYILVFTGQQDKKMTQNIHTSC